jgi:nitrilase
MPLLRQALYAQNINLYLAPTADGRDAWLSLLRTIGCEGRCFVVSSNMCAKPAATAKVDITEPARRQSSAVTEDGFDIALPSPVSPRSPGFPRRRRKSVFDEDGNQIVLCCDEETVEVEDVIAEDETTNSTEGPPTKYGTDTTAIPRETRRNRRKSVFDEDGNEIVLCCAGDEREPSTAPADQNRLRKEASALSSTQKFSEPPSRPRQRRKSVFDEHGNEIVLCCDVKEQDFPPSQPKKAEPTPSVCAYPTGGLSSRGGSAIVSPFGEVLAGPQWDDDDGIIFADVDFDECIKGRLDLDLGGSYARHDAFRFRVDGLDISPLPY